MRKFFSLGDGIPLTTVTLLVLGPVLFGLALVVFYPVLDPSWWNGLVFHPANNPVLVFWLFIMLNILLRPSDHEDDDEESRGWTALIRASDIAYAIGCGILFSLVIIADHETGGTARQNIAVYVAFSLGLLSLALRWHDWRHRRDFERNRMPEQT